MYKRCTTERAAQQQRRIEECLLNEMHKRDYRDITVSSLCEQAELSRKTFYRLFGSKDDVLQALIDHTLMDYAKYRLAPEQIHPGAPAELQRFFCYWIANKSLLDVLTVSRQSAQLLEQAIAHVLYEDHSALRWLSTDQHTYALEATVFYVSAIMGLLMNWHHSGFSRSVVEMANILLHLMSVPPIANPESVHLL